MFCFHPTYRQWIFTTVPATPQHSSQPWMALFVVLFFFSLLICLSLLEFVRQFWVRFLRLPYLSFKIYLWKLKPCLCVCWKLTYVLLTSVSIRLMQSIDVTNDGNHEISHLCHEVVSGGMCFDSGGTVRCQQSSSSHPSLSTTIHWPLRVLEVKSSSRGQPRQTDHQ